MKTATETENWRKKYFDSLESLESEQLRFRSIEAALKRIAGRLCTAALGQSRELDDQIKKVQAALRREITSEELDRITPALSEAIQGLDQANGTNALARSPSSTPSAAANVQATNAADEQIRAVLSGLLAELKRDGSLAARAKEVDEKLSTALRPEQLATVVTSISELIGERIQGIERAKQEVENLLSTMVGKLDEIGQFVAQQNRTQYESQASSETLSVQLVGEIKAMGETVAAARDLQQIRLQVRQRLDSIDRHLHEFREREAALMQEMRARNEQMRIRIGELEAEANRLQHALKDEQRLAMIDPLTQVANRLAYEARIDEELKRVQRFRQPASLAVWDVDHFKRINDTYGHRAGDRVLRAIADCLVQRVRSTDFIARFGGEEFVLILPGTALADAQRVCDELRIAITQIGFHFRGTPVSVTISCGITLLNANDSAGAAFDRADKALYRAKENGRNCCVCG